MARVCQVTGKRPMVGNNVSHANNKTKRRFLPNLQYRRFWLETENRWVRLRVTNAALRLIDKVGIDQVVADLVPAAHSDRSERWPPKADAKRSSWSRRPAPATSTRRTRTEDNARKARIHEVRSEGAQARAVQGNEAEVIRFAPDIEKPADGGFFVGGFSAKAACALSPPFAGSKPWCLISASVIRSSPKPRHAVLAVSPHALRMPNTPLKWPGAS